jgi:hypothetical protein
MEHFQHPITNPHSRVSRNIMVRAARLARCGAVPGMTAEDIAQDLREHLWPLRANKSETIEWLKFTLEGVGERTHGYAFEDTAF